MSGEVHNIEHDDQTFVFLSDLMDFKKCLTVHSLFWTASSEFNGIYMIWEPKGGANTSRSVVIIIFIVIMVIIMPRRFGCC